MLTAIGRSLMASLALVLSTQAAGAISSSFTYQGRIEQDGAAVDGDCDFELKLFDTAAAGSQVGDTENLPGVVVDQGIFTVVLDFGDEHFAGDDRWLEISVRCPAGSGDFTTFGDRHPLLAAPHALYAERSGAVAWENLAGVPPGFADGVDEDTVYSAGSGLSLSGSELSIAFDGSGSSDSAARSDHDHLGQTWNRTNQSLVIQGSYQQSPLGLANTTGDGLRIAAQDEGVEVVSAGDDGFRVVEAQDDGVRVESSGDDGFDVNNAGGDGLRVGSAGDVGVRVESAPLGALINAGPTGMVVTAEDVGIDVEVNGERVDEDDVVPTGVRVVSTDVGILVEDTTTVGVGVEGIGEEPEVLALTGGQCTIDAVPFSVGVMVNGVAGYGMLIEDTSEGGLFVSPEAQKFEDLNGQAALARLDPQRATTSGFFPEDFPYGIEIFAFDGVALRALSFNSVAFEAVSANATEATASIVNTGDAGNDALGSALYVQGAEGLSPDIILGGQTSNDEFGDNGTIASDPNFPSSDIVLFAQDDVGIFLEQNSQEDGEFGIFDALNKVFAVDIDGNVTADGTISSGGADFAELLAAKPGVEPGDVLAVDAAGELVRSSEAYQTTVVGVHSTKPGLLGGALDEADRTGKVPLAVVGIVPVKATNAAGPIEPGDLLVASALAGHAMSAGVDPPVGAVIGKALEPFDGDSGVIRMLVTLQ